ncbi:hypothetical protein [Leptotrichia hofstadii]|uniref:Lipoprotein n=1 Tax=Leptotrichia hofstadii F0254 TaxID=634994 RepID=C9MYI0_9FUSO|nr:hypothetical protein [Leptotrichia hofstadii]EEX74560.1 hypothetical protein GCWU000323_01608 [Leptotrichia hofstadii F0254]
MRTRIVKVILMIILGMSAVSCSLFDSNEWREAHRRSVEHGRTCYERANGSIYCKDTK